MGKRELLGRGAFAEVYLEETGGRVAACKVCDDADLLQREAEIQKQVQHPLFPEYYAFRRLEGKGMLWMEYVPGITLERFLRGKKHFSEAEAICIAVQLAEGLRYLHNLSGGLLFRDVKPQNILLTGHGRVKLLDFGCVCPVGSNPGVAGTPGFAAPEQLKFGGRLTRSCDVYGLGRVLQVMTGANCSKGLRHFTEACTRTEPGRRPPDMDWALELLQILASRGTVNCMQAALLKGEVNFQKYIG